MRRPRFIAALMTVTAIFAVTACKLQAGIEFVEVSTEFSVNPSEQNPVPLENFNPDIAPVARFVQGSTNGAEFFGIRRAYATPPSAWGFREGQEGSIDIDRRSLVFELTFFSAVSGLNTRDAGDGVATATFRGRSGRAIVAPMFFFQNGELMQIVLDGQGVTLPDLGGTSGTVRVVSLIPIGSIDFRNDTPEDAADEREPTVLTIDSLRIPAIVLPPRGR